jgi:hypothetical protein
MPGADELLGLVIVIFAVWVLLKVARVAIRLILFVVSIVIIIGAFYLVFVR